MVAIDVSIEDGEIEGEVGDDPSSQVFDEGDVKAKLRRLDAAINGSPSASARLMNRPASSSPGVSDNTPFRSKKEEKQWKRSQAQAAPAPIKQQPSSTPGYFDVYGPNVSLSTNTPRLNMGICDQLLQHLL